MKLLLIHPSRRGCDRSRKDIKAYIPPLTLPTLAGLTPQGIKVEIVDESVTPVDFGSEADLVGITGISSQINRGYEIADAFRKKGKKVVIGGIHASAMPDEAQEHADAVLRGEAEDLWETIIDDFRHGRLRERYGSESYPDLHRPVLPRYELLALDRYRSSSGTSVPRLPIQATRGCPFNCRFCSVTKFWGPKIRKKPLDNVEKELFHIKRLGTNKLFFTDDNFIADRKYTKELLGLLKKDSLSWICQVSTNIHRHEDLLAEMCEAGCTSVYVGIESFSTENLDAINKKVNTRADYTKLFSLFSKYNLNVTASMIVGLDGDTRESLNDMIEQLIAFKVSYVQLYITMLLPGTQLREQFLGENRIFDLNWDHQNGTSVTFQPRGFQPAALEEYYWELYRKFYSAGSIFKRFFTKRYLRRGLRAAYVPVRGNLYFRRRIAHRMHPIEN